MGKYKVGDTVLVISYPITRKGIHQRILSRYIGHTATIIEVLDDKTFRRSFDYRVAFDKMNEICFIEANLAPLTEMSRAIYE